MLALVFNTKKELNDPRIHQTIAMILSIWALAKRFWRETFHLYTVFEFEMAKPYHAWEDWNYTPLKHLKLTAGTWNTPQNGNGETSTQTTFFLVFQAFVFSGGVRCIYIWRSDCMQQNDWAPHRALPSVGIAHNTNWDVTLAQAKLSGLDDGWVFSYQRHLGIHAHPWWVFPRDPGSPKLRMVSWNLNDLCVLEVIFTP